MRQQLRSLAAWLVVLVLVLTSSDPAGTARAAAPVPFGNIHGWLLSSHGRPCTNTIVTIQSFPGRGGKPVVLGTTSTDAKGRFFFSIVEGTYQVQASSLAATASARVNVIKNRTVPICVFLR